MGGGRHHPKGQAIFTVLLNFGAKLNESVDAQTFVGTARKVGFQGDIVLAMSPGYGGPFLDAVKDANCIVYTIPVKCGIESSIHSIDELCSLDEIPQVKVSVNMLRFYIYNYWASLYDDEAIIMISDFSDVIFQSNPFEYKKSIWKSTGAQLVVFQENFPNKVINRYGKSIATRD